LSKRLILSSHTADCLPLKLSRLGELPEIHAFTNQEGWALGLQCVAVALEKDLLEGFSGWRLGSGVFLPVGNQALDGDGKDDLHVFIEDFVKNAIVGVASEEDNATLVTAPFQMG